MTPETSFTRQFLAETALIASSLDDAAIDGAASLLAEVRDHGGRLFILGAGGGAGHAGHAVNDFRKICDLESYAPSDNVSELTARVNDQGWDVAYSEWLRGSRLSAQDALLIFSVGGGSPEHNISMSLVNAMRLALDLGAPIISIVGRSDGFAAEHSTVCILIHGAPDARMTPHTEAFQAVVWHLLVSHPSLSMRSGTWESLAAK